MSFNSKDNVLVVPQRTTGEIEAIAEAEHYDVALDEKNIIEKYHEELLRGLPAKVTIVREHYTIKIKAWLRPGERRLQIATHLGGYGEPLRGRYQKTIKIFKIGGRR